MSVSPFRKPTIQHFWKSFALLWFCIFAWSAYLVLKDWSCLHIWLCGDACSQKGLLKTETEETFSLNFVWKFKCKRYSRIRMFNCADKRQKTK